MIKIPLKKKKIKIKCSGAEKFTVLLPSNAALPSLGSTIGPESEDLRDQWKNFKIYYVSDWEQCEDFRTRLMVLWLRLGSGRRGWLEAHWELFSRWMVPLCHCSDVFFRDNCVVHLSIKHLFLFLYFSQISQKCDWNPTAFLCNSDRNNNRWDINMDDMVKQGSKIHLMKCVHESPFQPLGPA